MSIRVQPGIKLNNVFFLFLILLSVIFIFGNLSELFIKFNVALPVYIIVYVGIIFLFGYTYKFGFNINIKLFLTSFTAFLLFYLFYSIYFSDSAGIRYSFRIFMYFNISLFFSLVIY